jgi:hypothetical protein
MTIVVKEVLLGNIAPRQVVISSKRYEISFNSLRQDVLQKEEVWIEEYVNTSGEKVFEIIPLH